MGSDFTTATAHKLSRLQVHPKSMRAGCACLSLDTIELFFPNMTFGCISVESYHVIPRYISAV